MVSMSSLDAINIDDGFDTKKFANQFKAFKDEMQQVFGVSLYDTNSILKQVETLPNEELEQVIKHCNALIERNTVEMGGVWIIKNVSLI